MITIREIAKKAKVSEGTVDRVIHNRGGVSKKTAVKVNQILKENNFEINPIARALAMKKRYSIAILIPEYSDGNIFWKSPHMGMLKALSELKSYGITLDFFFFDQFDSDSYSKSFDKLLKRRPDAIIFAPLFQEETTRVTKILDKLQIVYMLLNVHINGLKNISFIGQDSFSAGFVAGKLMALSLKNKGDCITVKTRFNVSDNNTIFQRINGFEDYIKSSTIKNKIFDSNFNKIEPLKEPDHKLNTLLKENENITGLFVPSSRASLIAYSLENKILDRLTIIGFDTTPANINCIKNGKVDFLISQKSFNQGYEAVRVMTEYLIHKKVPEKKIFSPIQIIIKENLYFSNRNKDSFLNDHTSTYQ